MSTTTSPKAAKTSNTSFRNLQVGEILSETQFYKVEKVVGDLVQLGTQSGESISVDSRYVETFLTSANQATSNQTITKTQAAELLLANPNVAMTVSFNKQVKVEDVAKEIMVTYANSTPGVFEKALKTSLKGALNGVERVIRGFHYGDLNELGRVNFVDMELYNSSNPMASQRQVDPRNINYIILKGVKYTVK